MRRRIRPPCSAQFNTLQFLPIARSDKPDATHLLSLKVSLLTGASLLLDDACMDVPRETVDILLAYPLRLLPLVA